MLFNVDEILKRGYDCFISENTIFIIKDGFTTQTPLDNTLKLMEVNIIETPSGSVEIRGLNSKEITMLLIDNHKVKKDIGDGVYDNITQ